MPASWGCPIFEIHDVEFEFDLKSFPNRPPKILPDYRPALRPGPQRVLQNRIKVRTSSKRVIKTRPRRTEVPPSILRLWMQNSIFCRMDQGLRLQQVLQDLQVRLL